jgi:hypothetical protein
LERAQAKEVKEKEKADDAARKLAEKQQKDREKALQTSQKGKHKASTLLPKQQKPQKQVSGGAASNVAPSAASPASARTTSRGRTVTLPSKFR